MPALDRVSVNVDNGELTYVLEFHAGRNEAIDERLLLRERNEERDRLLVLQPDRGVGELDAEAVVVLLLCDVLGDFPILRVLQDVLKEIGVDAAVRSVKMIFQKGEERVGAAVFDEKLQAPAQARAA